MDYPEARELINVLLGIEKQLKRIADQAEFGTISVVV